MFEVFVLKIGALMTVLVMVSMMLISADADFSPFNLFCWPLYLLTMISTDGFNKKQKTSICGVWLSTGFMCHYILSFKIWWYVGGTIIWGIIACAFIFWQIFKDMRENDDALC